MVRCTVPRAGITQPSIGLMQPPMAGFADDPYELPVARLETRPAERRTRAPQPLTALPPRTPRLNQPGSEAASRSGAALKGESGPCSRVTLAAIRFTGEFIG